MRRLALAVVLCAASSAYAGGPVARAVSGWKAGRGVAGALKLAKQTQHAANRDTALENSVYRMRGDLSVHQAVKLMNAMTTSEAQERAASVYLDAHGANMTTAQAIELADHIVPRYDASVAAEEVRLHNYNARIENKAYGLALLYDSHPTGWADVHAARGQLAERRHELSQVKGEFDSSAAAMHDRLLMSYMERRSQSPSELMKLSKAARTEQTKLFFETRAAEATRN